MALKNKPGKHFSSLPAFSGTDLLLFSALLVTLNKRTIQPLFHVICPPSMQVLSLPTSPSYLGTETLSSLFLSQGNRGRTGVVVAAYMHYSNISAR